MKRQFRTLVAAVGLSVVAIAPTFLMPGKAAAQVRGMNGHYIGAGVAAGVTNGPEDGSTFGGNIQGRLDVPRAPISARGAILFNDETSAIMPLLTYDAGIAPNTNVYFGGGYSFVESDDDLTPLGNQDSVVLTAGVESALARRLVVYGDAKLGLNAFKDSSDSAASFQVGLGYRF